MKSKRLNLFFRRMAYFFMQGLLYVAPIGLTFYIIIKILKFIDDILAPWITELLHFSIPGLGLILIVIFLTLLGIAGQSVIANPIKYAFERALKRAPLLHMVYSSIRDFMQAFVGKEKKFNQPVLVKVNKTSELEKLGFITQSDLSDLNIKDKVAVYFPHSYNFSGELFIVPVDQVTHLNVNSGELMKFIISGGISKV
jgi:uncharacterized membrane protein